MKSLFVALFLTILCLSGIASARELPQTSLPSYEPWSEETVAEFERILIQDGGRIKPIATQARFALLTYCGKTTAGFQTADGIDHKLDYSEWFLNVLFNGEVAKDLPVFSIDNSDVVVEIGVSPKAKRDRYSYNELFPGRKKLAELAAAYANEKKELQEKEDDTKRKLSLEKEMILNLGRNISSFEYYLGQFGFARQGEELINSYILPDEINQLAQRLDIIEMLDKMPELSAQQLMQSLQSPSAGSADEKLFADALRVFFLHLNTSRGLFLFPPKNPEDEVWNSASDLMLDALESKAARPEAAEQLNQIKALVSAKKQSPAAFSEALTGFVEWQHSLASAREEGLRADMENQLYHGNYFGFKTKCLFVAGFVLLAFSWLNPGSRTSRWLIIGASFLALAGFFLITYGITLRCLIRHRPPITNLYDTILFIAGSAVILGLIIELITRLGIGTLVGIVCGGVGMFLASKYEAKEATDTISQLLPVLDTNFWLATHVIIINLGYMAGLFAAIIGLIYIITRFILMLQGREDKAFFCTLTRMNYGVICFCLFFSLVGTVLGGIWANYSWGRFWGWDPKENGALMICLWCLAILHGRFAGWVRELGIHQQSLILAIIITFSWWGVNALGEGLHAYGFTDGIWAALFSFWGLLGIFLAMSVAIHFHAKGQKRARSEASNEAKSDAI